MDFLNDIDFEIVRQNLLRIAPMYIEAMKRANEINVTIDTNAIENLKQNADTINLMNRSVKLFAEQIIRFNQMNNGSLKRLIQEADTLNQINTQLVYLLKNIDFKFIFNQYKDFYDRLESIYHVDQQELRHVLNEYQWFVLPEMPASFVLKLLQLSKMTYPRKRINQLFFDYFAYNDYENLRDLVEKWASSGKFRPGRLKIIKDCLNAVANAKKGKIPSTLIVPALIAQIDGIQREILLKNDFKPVWTKFKLEGKGKAMNQNEAWNHIYSPEDEFSSIINDIILEVLFASALPGQPLKTPITFSRHKIMHGEHLNYGTKPNTIRTFIIIDFLHDLM